MLKLARPILAFVGLGVIIAACSSDDGPQGGPPETTATTEQASTFTCGLQR